MSWLTHDLDFSAILAATQDAKPSVVQIRAADVRPETVGPVLIEAFATNERTAGGRRTPHGRSGSSEIACAPAGFEIIVSGGRRGASVLSQGAPRRSGSIIQTSPATGLLRQSRDLRSSLD